MTARFQACVLSQSPTRQGITTMQQTQATLATALRTLGFQQLDYPSEKYQVFTQGSLRYFIDRHGNLRRGASISSSVSVNASISEIMARAATAQQRDDEERHEAHQHSPDPKEEQTTDDHAATQPEQRSARKQQILLDLLSRPEGATIPQLIAATGWQAHSVRGVMSGVLKKKLGVQVSSSKVAGGARIYRVAPEDKATPAVELR
jgi:hypothetical protein